MENSKVLVASPTYKGMKYCHERFLESLKNLDYENYDILLMDNSKTDEFYEELKKDNEIIVLKDETSEEKNILRLVSSRNKILEYALENNYDYVLMMDADVIAPKNILKDLLKHKKDIVSGLYYNYFNINREMKIRPVCWRSLTPEEFEEIKKQVNFPPVVKTHEDIRRHLTNEEIKKGECLEVKIPSAGCMLISKKVFEKIRYGLLDIPGLNSSTDDIYFCEKSKEQGFELYCDPTIVCDHLIGGKYEKDSEGNLIYKDLA